MSSQNFLNQPPLTTLGAAARGLPVFTAGIAGLFYLTGASADLILDTVDSPNMIVALSSAVMLLGIPSGVGASAYAGYHAAISPLHHRKAMDRHGGPIAFSALSMPARMAAKMMETLNQVFQGRFENLVKQSVKHQVEVGDHGETFVVTTFTGKGERMKTMNKDEFEAFKKQVDNTQVPLTIVSQRGGIARAETTVGGKMDSSDLGRSSVQEIRIDQKSGETPLQALLARPADVTHRFYVDGFPSPRQVPPADASRGRARYQYLAASGVRGDLDEDSIKFCFEGADEAMMRTQDDGNVVVSVRAGDGALDSMGEPKHSEWITVTTLPPEVAEVWKSYAERQDLVLDYDGVVTGKDIAPTSY